MGGDRSHFKVLTGKPIGKRPLGSLGVHGRTMLEWNLMEKASVWGTGLFWLRIAVN
jgi:hypothetical protein